ncbi:MAG TPA: Na-translocating system protein MpsC family protein [Solirubrobacteraceae bacterium]|nr:Na-translocating system protein MpsC family protein [Solirubrobacteraceae bacterium]
METSSQPDEANNGRATESHGRLAGTQLAALSNAMVGLHRRYFGRGATKARAYQVSDDLVLVELRDVYLTVERTLIDRGQANTVRQTRLTFQQAMFGEFLIAVEEATGRKVRSYITESIISPEAVLEIFYLEPIGDVEARMEREAREDAGEIERPYGGIADAEE